MNLGRRYNYKNGVREIIICVRHFLFSIVKLTTREVQLYTFRLLDSRSIFQKYVSNLRNSTYNSRLLYSCCNIVYATARILNFHFRTLNSLVHRIFSRIHKLNTRIHKLNSRIRTLYSHFRKVYAHVRKLHLRFCIIYCSVRRSISTFL